MTPRSPELIRQRLDFWQALSGACLAFFVCIHLLLEGSVVLSPDLTDAIGWLLEVTYAAQLGAPCILLLIVFHFWIAARKMPFRAGELAIFVDHARTLKDPDTWLWLVQVATAVIILVGAFFHVYTVMCDLPIEVVKSSKRRHQGWLLFHAFFLPSVIVHTGIGIFRIAVKYGFCVKARREVWRRRLWIGMGCYLLLGVLALSRVWCQG